MKNFGKLFMVFSMLTLCIGFTSCVDTEPDAEKVTISLEAGVATETSLSFKVTSSGADSGVYWIYKATEPTDLNIKDGMIIEVNKEYEVVVENLEPNTRYNVNAYAKNLVYEATSNSISMKTLEEVPTPTIVVEMDNKNIKASSVSFALTVKKAEKAAWLIQPMDDDLSAEEVLTNGTLVDLTAGQTVTLTKEGLTPNTKYDLWIAAKNGDKVAAPYLKTFTTPAE